MDQIADLVIDLSIDTADFKEQLPRVKNLLNGTAREAERAEARMKRFEESQKQAASATVIQTQAVVKHAQGHVSLAEDVERARLRMEALSRQMREEQVQAAALAAAQDKMAAAFYRQIDSVKQASAGLQELQRIQQQIRQARNSGGIAQQDYLALISEVTAKTRVLTQAEETATRQKTAFIRQLKEQTSRQKMTTTELLRAKAAQLGCSSAAEVYIRKMEKAGNTTHSLGLKSAAARRELGVMIGELARGNFGALRGSGITLANRAGWIDKLMTPKGLAVGGVIGGITAAVIGLGKAWMEGQEEGEAFNRQLELTGHYAGVTAGQLWALSENLSGNGITQHAMAGSLAQVVGSGAFHGNDIGMVAKAAAQMERSVGQSVSDTISQFKRLKDDPVSAAKALDDELHFLTATQLEQIRVLGEQGRTSDAARIPEKEAIVDNGAHFDGDQSGTVNGVTPPAVQHLTAEVTADSGEYQVLARWDTPKVVKGVSFMLRLTVAADDGSERLVSTARTTETTYRFRQLALGRYTLTVRAVNARGQQGDPASVSFRIAAPAAPSRIELTPGYFQITATPHLAVYDPTVQFEFWFSETRITDIRQVETTARYLGTGLYWIAASINIKPGHDYYFYIRSVNTVGKSAFVEAVGRASDDAEGYLDFFKGKITESHLGKELLEKVDLTEDNASRLDEFSKEWKDANDKWNAMWGVKIEQTKDGKHYVAGIGLSMEDTEEGKLSQFLVAANRIAFIDPANGNETPMFVAQGNQIFMNDVFLKRLTAPTITSGGSPPVFSLTSDGKLTAKNADISGSVNANSGTLNNVTINQNCTIKGMLEATQVRGDFVKAVSKAFPKKVGTWGNTETPNGTVTVTISDDHNFDRQIIIPPIIFNGIAYDDPGSGNNPGGTRYTGYGFEVRKNGVLIASRETKGAIPGSYSAVIDMPSGGGSVTLEFKVFQKGNQGAGNITDCTVIVTKKAASGISIR